MEIQITSYYEEHGPGCVGHAVFTTSESFASVQDAYDWANDTANALTLESVTKTGPDGTDAGADRFVFDVS